jgi:putative transcriptional regulator
MIELNGLKDWGEFKSYSIAPLETGSLILATPFMDDPNFIRTVVLLVEHGTDGSLGFVLNRPIELNLYHISSDFKGLNLGLYIGGPVQMDTLHFLHRMGPDFLGDCMEVAPGIFWGGDIELVKERIQDNLLEPHQINFYIGYAGWAEGQLEHEFNRDSWIALPAKPEDVFSGKDRQLWSDVLRNHRAEHRLISTFPVNPRHN